MGRSFAVDEANPENWGGVDPLALYKFKLDVGKVPSSSFNIFEGREIDSIGSDVKLSLSANLRGKFVFVLFLLTQVASPST